MDKTRGLWRGKRVDNGEWVQGSYVMDAMTQEYGVEMDGFIRRFNPQKHKSEMFEVNGETLGECTGLRDKNGKFIFEGDIIRYKKHLFCIEWSADICSFTSRALDGANFMPCVNVGTMKNYEVIGNIHDNSELLKRATGEDIGNTAQDTIMPAT